MKKILAVSPDAANGCTYHRIIVPAYNLKNHEVTLVDNLDNATGKQLQGFDIVWFNRFFGIADEVKQMERLKKLGIPYVIDIDDYWELSTSHLNYKSYIKSNAANRQRELIRNAAAVITTTDLLASYVRMINKNVVVAPNALDDLQPQFLNSGINVERMRFGWIGGVHHFEDIMLLRDTLSRIIDEDKVNIALGGYADNDIYRVFENWFSRGNSYKKYSRIDGSDVFNYGFQYDQIDVALVPLVNSKFNNCKSQLKIIEAGFKGKAVISSNVHPYTIDLNEKNSLLVGERIFDFYKAIKKLNENPILALDLAAQLTLDVKEKYSIKAVNVVRDELFNYI